MGSQGVAAAGPDVPTVDSVDLESDQLTEVRRLLFGAESAAPPRKRRRGGKVYSVSQRRLIPPANPTVHRTDCR